MDFQLHDTAEQIAFRKEVRAWLEANIPKEFEDSVPTDMLNCTEEQFLWARDFERKLGVAGWFAPTMPKEYGGGGLSLDQSIVLAEEIGAHNLPATGNVGYRLFSHAMLAWGSEEQKRRFLTPILRGEVCVWQLFTEPEAGSDLASLKTRAVEDGDDFVINGNKIFVGEKFHTDYFYALAVTDPTAPRHNNMGAFLIPANLPGITIDRLDLIAGGGKRAVFFEDTRVPREYLIGGKTQGWWVANSTLEVEHGGGGRAVPRNHTVDALIAYAKQTIRRGQPLIRDPLMQRRIVDAYINAHVGRLLNMRNFWMRENGIQGGHEGSQASLHGKTSSPELARAVRETLGPWALIDDPELAPARGEFEHQQRSSILTSPGGTPNIQKLIMARRIGMSRTPLEQQGSRDVKPPQTTKTDS